MVCFVDQNDVRVLYGASDTVGPVVGGASEISVAVADERLEVAGQVGEETFDDRRPDVFLRCLRSE